MSTNSECLIVQVRTDQWYYVLEHRNAPKDAWDWREYADAYGPFATEEQANEHLFRNHANPGGTITEMLPAGRTELDLSEDNTLRELIAAAPRNTR